MEGERAAQLSEHIAPGLAEIGCMLPYAPLHALLLQGVGLPLVATSGNVSGEPVITANGAAQTRLALIADAFLHHDRPIVRPADDSVLRVIAGRARPLRLGRGMAPLELDLPRALPKPVLALGAHTKNTLCLAWARRAVISPHIADLSSAMSLDTFAQVADDLQRLYQVRATRLIADRHPGYGYRAWARAQGLPLSEVWHHHAHASALAWEFPEVRDWIVFAWDGVGLGEDGTLWGGEALLGAPGRWARAASLRPFHLPGGERAGREPWRAAAALLWETGRAAPLAPELLHEAWRKRINSPASSAAGRLFDAAAALTGICTHASFEGEGPMRLEALAGSARPHPGPPPLAGEKALDWNPPPQAGEKVPDLNPPPQAGEGRVGGSLPLARDHQSILRTDWSPLIPMLQDSALTQTERALRFHHAMAGALVDQAIALRDEAGSADIGLTGGVFQNRLLAELALSGLREAGFRVHLPERVPVNDAGVSLGQIIETLYAPTHE
jgi:hydrogenase maturation protein HypF